MLATAPSTASTPADQAARRVASWPPAVSWVCRCTGRSNRSRSAVTSRAAGGGPTPPGAAPHRRGGGRGGDRAGNVLDRQSAPPRRDDLLGQPQVVVEG